MQRNGRSSINYLTSRPEGLPASAPPTSTTPKAATTKAATTVATTEATIASATPTAWATTGTTATSAARSTTTASTVAARFPAVVHIVDKHLRHDLDLRLHQTRGVSQFLQSLPFPGVYLLVNVLRTFDKVREVPNGICLLPTCER